MQNNTYQPLPAYNNHFPTFDVHFNAFQKWCFKDSSSDETTGVHAPDINQMISGADNDAGGSSGADNGNAGGSPGGSAVDEAGGSSASDTAAGFNHVWAACDEWAACDQRACAQPASQLVVAISNDGLSCWRR